MKIWKTRETMFIFKLHSAELHTFWRDILAWFSNWFRESILDLWDPAASKEIHFCNNSNLRKSCWRKVLHLLSNLRLSKRNNLRHNSRVNSKPRKGFLRGRWPSCTTISVLSMKTSFFRPPLSRDKLHESMYLWFFTFFRVSRFDEFFDEFWISFSFSIPLRGPQKERIFLYWSTICRTEFSSRPPSMPTCHSSGTRPGFRSYPTRTPTNPWTPIHQLQSHRRQR